MNLQPPIDTADATRHKIAELVADRVPEWAAPYCRQLSLSHSFSFRLARARTSKLGDFTATPTRVVITLNSDLNPELFLITFLHELAHLIAFSTRKRREAPHGPHWKHCYGKLLQNLCGLPGMDEGMRKVLLLHSLNPTATLQADAALARLLHVTGAQDSCTLESHVPLIIEHIEEGHQFLYRGRPFLKSGKLSKRHYATELASGRMFSFAPTCRVTRPHGTVALRPLCLGKTLQPGQQFVFRDRKFSLLEHQRTKMTCTDLATGQRIALHKLMHVEVEG